MVHQQTDVKRAIVREALLGWRRAVSDGDGVRWTIVRRLRELVGIERLEESVQILESRLQMDGARHDQQMIAAHAVIETLQEKANALSAEITRRGGADGLLNELTTFTAWVASVPLTTQPLVSVVLATSGQRPTSLHQAFESIRCQSYDNFEVLVVSPNELTLPATYANDQRFRKIVTDSVSVGQARNVGLDAASGDLVTYADDDNTMGPHWLRAVAWAFTSDSGLDVVYGARLHESLGTEPASAPAFWWFEREWNPDLLQSYNPIDTQVLAHRAGLREARWDEGLTSCVDWDLAIRLTARGRVRPLPVHACTYMTSSPGRITELHNTDEVRAEIRLRAKQARRIRVLGVTHSFPRYSEFYVESELDALRPTFDVAVASEYEAFPGTPSDLPHLGSIEQGIAAHRPELVVFHFTDVALRVRPLLAAHGIPYAVRVHSYDVELAAADPFHDDPNCIGLWAYPHHADRIPHAHALPTLIHDSHRRSSPPIDRSGVAYVSACLPKRDWYTVGNILGSLTGIERTAILATCHGYEDFIPSVVALLEDYDSRINIRCDVANSVVLRTLSVVSCSLYVGAAGQSLGNPRSVVEAWICGSIPVMQDTPEIRAFAGNHARYFTNETQAVEIIRSLQLNCEELEKERLDNMDFALESFAHPQVFETFAGQMRTAFNAWESRSAAAVNHG